MENDDAVFYAALTCSVIKNYDDEGDVVYNTSTRGRAYRRKMFFKKEKYAKDQDVRRRDYVRNERFLYKHIPDIFDDDFQGISNRKYSISILEKSKEEHGKLLLLVENHINKTESIFAFSHTKGETEVISWWKPLRKLPQDDFEPIYYERFYPNVKGFKRFANKRVRHHKIIDEDGMDVSFSSRTGEYRKIFDSYEICEY